MKYKIIVIVVLVILVVGLGYLSDHNNKEITATDNPKLQVAASFYPLYFFASQIGGNKVKTVNITPAGAEPHDYEPTPKDIATIDNSKLIVLNGAGLEAWGDKITPDLNANHISVVKATFGITLLNNPDAEEAKNTPYDPHAWVNPITAKTEVENILLGFEKADPVNKDFYDANAAKLNQHLDQIDAEYKEGLSRCRQKSIVTSHAAFGYLAQQYGLTQVPIAGLSPDAEPSAQQLAQIADYAKKNQIKYIFFEALVNPKLSQTIANEVGAQTLVLNPIEGLTNDEIKSGKDYFSVLEQNLANLKIALQCE
jgi:zinc transport system substrate-binding protein